MKFKETVTIIFFLWTACHLSAQKTEWIGGTGIWHEANNWTKGIPTNLDTAIIDQVNAEVSIEANAQAYTIIVGDSVLITNQSGFLLSINPNPGNGIFNDGAIVNHGTILIENVTDCGVDNNGTILNMGTINVDNAFDGVVNNNTFHNFGTLDIANVNRDGLANFGIFNSTDKITIKNVTRDGLVNFDTLNILAPVVINNCMRDGVSNFEYLNQQAQLDICIILRNGITNFEEIISNADVKISECQEGGLRHLNGTLKIMTGSTWSITQIGNVPLFVDDDTTFEVETGAIFNTSN